VARGLEFTKLQLLLPLSPAVIVLVSAFSVFWLVSKALSERPRRNDFIIIGNSDETKQVRPYNKRKATTTTITKTFFIISKV
jgi:hypothetical protein